MKLCLIIFGFIISASAFPHKKSGPIQHAREKVEVENDLEELIKRFKEELKKEKQRKVHRRGWLDDTWDSVKDTGSDVIDWGSDKLSDAGDWVDEAKDDVQDWAGDVGDWFKEKKNELENFFSDTVDEDWKKKLRDLGNQITTTSDEYIQDLEERFEELLGDWEERGEDIMGSLEDAKDVIKDECKEIWEEVKELDDKIEDWLDKHIDTEEWEEEFRTALLDMKAVGVNIYHRTEEEVIKVKDGMMDFLDEKGVTDALSSAVGGLEDLGNGLHHEVEKYWEKFTDQMDEAGDWLDDNFENLDDKIAESLEEALEEVQMTSVNAWDKFSETLDNITPDWEDDIEDLGISMEAFISEYWQKAEEYVVQVWDDLNEWLDEINWLEFEKTFDDIVDEAAEAKNDLQTTLSEVWDKVEVAVQDEFGDEWETVKDKLEEFKVDLDQRARNAWMYVQSIDWLDINFSEYEEWLEEKFESVSDSISDAEFVRKAEEIARDLINDIEKEMPDFEESIKETVGNMHDFMHSVNDDIREKWEEWTSSDETNVIIGKKQDKNLKKEKLRKLLTELMDNLETKNTRA